MDHARSSRRVLVVDDEVVIADTLSTILTLHHYDAFTCYSAEEAIPKLGALRPHVVVTDVVMGAINGVELAIHIAETYPDCKVLLLSGHSLTSTLLEMSEKLGYSFPILAKPAQPQDILDTLAALLPPLMASTPEGEFRLPDNYLDTATRPQASLTDRES